MLDEEGEPTTEPVDFFGGGALLPFGSYKGYGLSVILEAMVGGLSARCSHDTRCNGVLYVALDPSQFTPIEEFVARTDGFIRHLRASPPVPGVEEVLVPGEIDNSTMKKRAVEGIPVDEAY